MKNVLIINTSPTPNESVSTQLTAFFKKALLATGLFHTKNRDLGLTPPRHLTALALSGFFIDPSEHTEEQKCALSESTTLIKELESADIIIIGSAMHNHTVTSGLKAYIDQITRPGLTFTYKDDGPHGLLMGKKVFVIISAGGDYSSQESQSSDFVTPLLTEVLGFIGLKDITFIPVFSTYSKQGVFEKNKKMAEEKIEDEINKLRQEK